MYLVEAAQAVSGSVSGDNVKFTSVSTDTRTIQAGDLFVALKGPNFNGHNYIEQAAKAGACALMVSEPVDTSLPYVTVENTERGLGSLAAAWKEQFDIPTVAITGSCGKTTVKEMVASILSLRGKTLATKGNFNNEIGVPLTLLSINETHQYAVIELGANHIGEIAYTVSLVKPSVAAITNAGSAHIEGFGSAENVARAKGEIYQGVVANGKTIINLDDHYCEYWKRVAEGYEVVGFSLENPEADFFATDIHANKAGQHSFVLHANGQLKDIQLPLMSKHNIINAITAAAIAMAVGATMEQVKAGLEALKPIRGRLCPITLSEQIIIDDTYNANPVSIKAAAAMLGELNAQKSCIVLGDMAELGTHSPSMHREVGEFIAKQGIDCLVAKGKHAADYLVGFNKNQSEGQKGVRFDEYEEVVRFLQDESPDTILIKGSRSAAMENVVRLLCEPETNEKGLD